MAILDIVKYGEPVLETPGEPVTEFDAKLKRLVSDMFETMYSARGVGLAAPQIGVSKRLFVMDCSGGRDPEARVALINPVVLSVEGEQTGDEGCLSFPGLAYPTKRAYGVVARGFNMHGEPVTLEGTGQLARCVQHETDHLDGVLFIDRLDPETRKLAMREIRESDWWGDTMPVVKVSPHPTWGKAL